jgi:hypothetical protein
MKIPRELLEAPMDELLGDDLLGAFKKLGYTGIPIWTNTGCAFFCYMDKKTCRQVKSAVHNVKLEYHEIDGCPLLRFDIKIYDQPVQPLHFDVFPNVQNEHHLLAIEALTVQEWLIFHWYGPDFKYTGSTGVHWREEQRVATAAMINQAKELVARTGGGNFDKAKAKFMAENPIS